MIYGSVCSGIEAATVAWHPLGWRPAFFSEIEKFPCSVLSHHYGSNLPGEDLPSNGVPNLGDMTKFEGWPDYAIELLVGGTPCQAFSVAGLRNGLDDARGNLMLVYGAIARRYRPKWLVWENVPGVLSSDKGRDFASLLGLLSGRRVEAPASGWKSAGVVPGIASAYGLAWRVLDAQFVRVDGYERAVPQRRRRVFVVGYIGDWRRSAAVLFERESLCGNPPPRREARKRSTAGFEIGPGGNRSTDLSPTLDARCKDGPIRNQLGLCVAEAYGLRSDAGRDGIAKTPSADADGRVRLRDPGFSVSEGFSPTLDAGAAHIVAHPLVARCDASSNQRMDAETETLIAFQGRGTNVEFNQDVSGTLSTGIDRASGAAPCVAHTLRGNGHDASEDGTGRGTPLVAVPSVIPMHASGQEGSNGAGIAKVGDPMFTLDTHGSAAVGTSADEPTCFSAKDHGADAVSGISPTLRAGGFAGSHANAGVMPAVASGMMVRRLMPVECLRLQGFPDDYLDVIHRGKPAADGPKYKAIGNSMACNVMRWIGQRIEMVDAINRVPPKPETRA